MEEYIIQARNIENNSIISLTIRESYDENDNIVLSTKLDGSEYMCSDYSYFEAFKKLKDVLLQLGYGLNCLGAKINAVQSGMASSSDKIYLVEIGKQARGLVSLYDYCDNDIYPNKVEQDSYYEKWFNSKKG